jgi:biopolymer transport protein ExbB
MFNLADVFRHMQPFAWVIVISLALMALVSISVFVERLWVYRRSRRLSRVFAGKAGPLLERGDHAGLIALADQHRASHLAGMIGEGMRAYVGAKARPGELPPVELTRRELARRSEAISADVRKGHSALASVGSVGPFVGLLGTVVGIIASFQGISKEGSGGLSAVSAGIAEALVVTAIGLLVAIPAVLMFNMLSTKADQLLLALDQSKGELLDYLENHGDGSAASRAGINGVHAEAVGADAREARASASA